ncbi:hypothetical protein CUC44_17600 [Aeromonas lusitana]|uniref:Uncharacterized protein n=1 Tax=Aeromonas lusitana TaxID=931529 RepID=A0A2M8H573_9GAMM|nr:hypothetical protein CUC44_17600 [Aeromonas lusitana]
MVARFVMAIAVQLAHALCAGRRSAPFSPRGRRDGDEGDILTLQKKRGKKRGAVMAPLFAMAYLAARLSD